jgi:hypothetical protein
MGAYALQAAVIQIVRAERLNIANRKQPSSVRRAYDFELVPVRTLAAARGSHLPPLRVQAYDAEELRAEEEEMRFPPQDATYLELANNHSAHLANDWPFEEAFDDEYCMVNKVVLGDGELYLALRDHNGRLYRMEADASWLAIPVAATRGSTRVLRPARSIARLRSLDDWHIGRLERAIAAETARRRRLDLPWYEQLWRGLFGSPAAPKRVRPVDLWDRLARRNIEAELTTARD